MSFPIQHQIRVALVLSAVAVFSLTPRATQHRTEAVPLSVNSLVPLDAKLQATRHRDSDAIQVTEAKGRAGGAMALVKDVVFRDGTIELDVAGRRGPNAAPDDRGFIGVAFRVQPGGERYECVYLRPENGRAEDQVRRNHSVQYVAHPDFPWHRLRKESPGKYETYTDLEPDVWTRIRVEVAGIRMRLFIHEAPQPVLIVDDLKLGADLQGGVALWIGAGTEGYFRNLLVTPKR